MYFNVYICTSGKVSQIFPLKMSLQIVTKQFCIFDTIRLGLSVCLTASGHRVPHTICSWFLTPSRFTSGPATLNKD